MSRQSFFFENILAKIDGCPGQARARRVCVCIDISSPHTTTPLAAGCARAVHESFAQGGRGERRMPAAPAASCALCIGKKHTSKRVHRNHPAFPRAMVLTVSFALSPVISYQIHTSRNEILFQWVSGSPALGHQVLPQSSQVTLVTHIFRRPD